MSKRETSHRIDKLADLTWNWWEEGKLVRQELDKQILSSGNGGWFRIAYLYRDLIRSTGKWGKPTIALVKYRRFKDKGIVRIGGAWHLNARQTYVFMHTSERWLKSGADANVGGRNIALIEDANLVPRTKIIVPEMLDCPAEYASSASSASIILPVERKRKRTKKSESEAGGETPEDV